TFDWAAPDDEVHAFVNDLVRPVGTHLYGRRMYEAMVYWETADAITGLSPVAVDFAAVWQAADKIGFSRTLEAWSTARTRLQPALEPEAVRRLKASAERDLSIGGADLAGQAIRAGLVDELGLFVTPVVVGGGTRALPDDVRLDLELLDEVR